MEGKGPTEMKGWVVKWQHTLVRGPVRGVAHVPCLNFTSSQLSTFRRLLMSRVGISSKRNCDIGVAFPISLEQSLVRRQFVALVWPFQGHVACRNLPLTRPLVTLFRGAAALEAVPLQLVSTLFTGKKKNNNNNMPC